ncbi:MAG TPA: tripartite tricarboxylate transporter substrate-binding protein [Methylomirabilota bacterium]|nr:tripartite tricarboxylate transporter substrate-binding protein [Methylomirabilota bacterium]
MLRDFQRAKLKTSLFFLSLICLSASADADAQNNFYQGKTIKLIVGSSTGGGYDLWARLLARHYGKHIPGNPTIVVQNMPGAASVVAANYLYSVAKPDGLTLGALLPAIYFDQLVGRPEVKFDFAKIGWIGSPEQNDIVHYMRADSPYKSIDDIRKAKEPPRCGSSGTGTTGFYIPRLLDEVFGTKHTIVSGYQGGSEIDLAIERGEVHCWSPLVATFFGREPYISWFKKGFVRVLLQTNQKRDPRLADVPTIYELMERYKTPEAGTRLVRVILTAATLGRPIAVTPGTPTDRLKLLREAYLKTLKDPELLAEAKKQRWEIDPLSGEEMEKLAKEVVAQPKDVIERMKWVLGN